MGSSKGQSTSKGSFHQPGKNRKSLVSGGGSGGGVAGVVVAARLEVAVVVVATMALVWVSLLTLYRPSATVLVIHFVLKVIFPEYKKTFKNS